MTPSTEPDLNALENERRYVARELHDGIAQTVLQLSLQIGICRKLLEQGKVEMLNQEMFELEERTRRASSQVREIIADMRPPKVEPGADLAEYLQHMIDIHHERGGAPVSYQVSTRPVLSLQQTLNLTRIVQEALLNVRKHAEADQVWVQLFENDKRFLIRVTDDGSGFDLAEIKARQEDRGGAGLAGLQMRAEAIGGALTITGGSDDIGTRITVTWPK